MTSTRRELIPGNLYDKAHTKNPIARMLCQGYLRALDELLSPMDAGNILEVGSGEGLIVEHLWRAFPASGLMAIDLSFGMACMTRDRIPATQSMCASASELPFPTRSFDLVLCVEVLEHLEEPGRAAQEIVRVGKGNVILSVPREPIWRILNALRGAYLRDLGNTPGHVQHWTAGEFIRFAHHHLEVDRICFPFLWVMISGRIR